MLYTISKDFTRLAVTAGTIQNNGYVYPIEISDRAEADSGILLYPLNKFSFSGTTFYVRCVGGASEVRVVPFLLDFGGISSAAEQPTDVDPYNLVSDMWASDDSVIDADATVADMWNSGVSGDTDDGFVDRLNEIFNP